VVTLDATHGTSLPTPLYEAWRRLAADDATPFSTPEWALSVAAATPSRRLGLVVVGDLDDPRALLPLAHAPAADGGPRVEVAGVSLVPEPVALACTGTDALSDALQAVLGRDLPLSLGRVWQGSPLDRAVQTLRGPRPLVVARPDVGTPWLLLPASGDDVDRRLRSSRRSQLRRAERRAETWGRLSLEVLSPTPEEVEARLDLFVAVEARSWKSAEGTSLRQTPGPRTFFRTFLHHAAATGAARVGVARLDERPVAAALAVEHADQWWLLKIGYDEDARDLSPGTLLVHHTVRWAADAGLAGYEFLGADAPWIRLWTDQVRPTRRLTLYPRRPNGLVALAGDTAGYAARRVR
jgi:CelD/BcsL family acetyltransferase involved in cellulose biosynthesis